MLGSCLRARWMENETASFLRTRPDALGVSLGAGLDTLYLRLCDSLGEMDNDWYDVDAPQVIALKRNLLTETNRYRMLASELADPRLIGRLPWQAGQPPLFILEDVLMYMEPVAVTTLLQQLIEAAAWRGSPMSILFDFCSPMMARQKRRRPCRWSLEHPQELQWLHPRLRVEASYDLLCEGRLLPRMLGWAHRRVTGRLYYGCVHIAVG